MAKKKRGTEPETRGDGAVINQLFGSLESDTEIESDIAELGAEAEQETVVEKKPPKRFFFVFAVFVIVMAVLAAFQRCALRWTVREILWTIPRLKTSSRSLFSR